MGFDERLPSAFESGTRTVYSIVAIEEGLSPGGPGHSPSRLFEGP
jgi:hypothetical protein